MELSSPQPCFAAAAADREAHGRLLAVEPVWTGLAKASEAMDLPARTLLHAGPPVATPGLAAPIRNSAIAAIVFEGWAQDFAQAAAMLAAGDIVLRPAQDFRAVVPLAAILSPSMVVHIVVDRADPRRRTFSPLNGGSGPAMRLGQLGPAVVDHLRWLNGPLANTLGQALQSDVALIPIADRALACGDDCHGRTVKGTEALLEILSLALTGEREGARARRFLGQSPGFFLNLWMAASKCIVSAAEGSESSIVTAMGANGSEVGLQVGGIPGRWFCAPAQPPAGPLEPGYGQQDKLGAIGDSAIVEALGLGAMAMSYAPEQAKVLGAFMPEASETLAGKVLLGEHRSFSRTGPRVGLSARRIFETGARLAVALGILDRSGRAGRIGGGIYAAPLDPFAAACKALGGVR